MPPESSPVRTGSSAGKRMASGRLRIADKAVSLLMQPGYCTDFT